MALDKDIAKFLETHADMNPDELRKAFVKSLKATRPSEITKDFHVIVKKYKTTPLNKLKKVLTQVFTEIHGDSPPMPAKRKESQYNVFMKEQSKLLAEEMPNATQRERMQEIGKRWQLKKSSSASTATDATDATAKTTATTSTTKNANASKPNSIKHPLALATDEANSPTSSPPRKRLTRQSTKTKK